MRTGRLLVAVGVAGAALVGAGQVGWPQAPPSAGSQAMSVVVETPTRLLPLPPEVAGEGGWAAAQTQPYDARPVTFDPCRPVRWAVRRDGEVPGGDLLLEESVAEVSRLTGLAFERVPDTDEPPSADRALVQHDRYGPGAAPVLVVWSDERAWPALSGLVAGVAGSSWLDVGRADGRRYVTGQLVLDGEQLAQVLDGRDGRERVRAVLLHELAHVVGLDHVDDAEALMSPLNRDQVAFGDGDRRGLRALGDGQCFTDWELVVGR